MSYYLRLLKTRKVSRNRHTPTAQYFMYKPQPGVQVCMIRIWGTLEVSLFSQNLGIYQSPTPDQPFSCTSVLISQPWKSRSRGENPSSLPVSRLSTQLVVTTKLVNTDILLRKYFWNFLIRVLEDLSTRTPPRISHHTDLSCTSEVRGSCTERDR